MRLLILTTLVVATFAVVPWPYRSLPHSLLPYRLLRMTHLQGLYDNKKKHSFPQPAPRTCYGDVRALNPTGRKKGGVTESNRMIEADEGYLLEYLYCFVKLADKFCIQASILGAIASRESRGGALLYKTNGYGDNGNAYGIMQCNIRYSGLNCTSVPWNSCAHIEMMTEKLIIPFIKQVKKKHPKWPAEWQLQGGVAAYNFGVRNVKSWTRLDFRSTDNDYSNDVIARAKWLKIQRWWN